jgi:hypothetical protein
MKKKTTFKTVWLGLLLAALLLSGCGAARKSLDVTAFYEKLSAEFSLPEMMELSEKRMENYYGLNPDACVQMLARLNRDGQSVDEIWLIEAKGDAEAAEILKLAEFRVQQVCKETENYSPEQYAVAKEAKTVKEGSYVALFISPDAKAMAELFQKSLKG